MYKKCFGNYYSIHELPFRIKKKNIILQFLNTKRNHLYFTFITILFK